MYPQPDAGVVEDGCGTDNCFDPWEETAATRWSYVGRGRGDFEPLQTYGFVGRGAGSFQKEVVVTPQRWRLKPWCFALLAFGVLTACVHVYARTQSAARHAQSPAPAPSVRFAPARQATQEPHPDPPQPIVRPRFLCAAPTAQDGSAADGAQGDETSGPAALIGAAILEAAWVALDRDGDGFADIVELDQCDQEKLLSARGLWLLRASADAAEGRLKRALFVSTLARAGLFGSPATIGLSDAVATSTAEAAWIVASKSEDGRMSLGELHALLSKARPVGKVRDVPALLTPREVEMLAQADQDHDGRLDHTEFRAGLARAGLALFVPDESSRSVVAAAAGEILWNAADLGRDGRLSGTELGGLQKRHELARSVQLPPEALAGPGLPHDAFVDLVAQDDLGSKLVRLLADTPSLAASPEGGKGSWALATTTPIDAWSTSKRSWCCENVGLGCEWEPPSLLFDCKGMPTDWSEDWPEARRAWCCQHGASGPGCAAAAMAPPLQAAHAAAS